MADKALTVGGYLAARLSENGVGHYFTVPGDYNLVLLDEFLKHDGWEMISCCNELNAGYAADGYARATGGLSAAVVTYSVGGLSLINAVAGAYAEDLPMVAISGGPNSNSTAEAELLHHSIGHLDYTYVREMFSRVTAKSVIIHDPEAAARQIDDAIATACRARKPVYLEIACNIASCPITSANPRQFEVNRASDPVSLAAAVDAVAALLNSASSPVLVAGSKLRSHGAEAAFAGLADSCGYGVASMPNAKSFFDESHPSYMGIHWGDAGTGDATGAVLESDMVLLAGCIFTDYTTTGHTIRIDPDKRIEIHADGVVTPDQVYYGIELSDFLEALAIRLNPNEASLVAWRNRHDPAPDHGMDDPDGRLTTRQVFSRIQKLLDEQSALIAETGDSWFNGMQLDMPSGSRFEIQMQYGSIGWSVGATLGYAIGAPQRRVIACIGDGSFQLTAQELSTMIRYNATPLIFLMNNRGYTIEVEIHDGPYNNIANWNYAELMGVLGGEKGGGRGFRAGTGAELEAAIVEAVAHDGPCLIEVLIDRDDCNPSLIGWGTQVAKNNGRPPRQVGC